jgi:glutathione synthase
LFALDEEDPKTCKVIAEAIAHPHKYVLKPQREGGGNNLYGEEMVKVLKAASNPSDLAPYILMTLITPKARPNSLVKESLVYDCDTVSELGIYGTYLVGSDGQAKLNVPAGYLLRTKAVGVLEGGVASGFSVLDSLQLI